MRYRKTKCWNKPPNITIDKLLKVSKCSLLPWQSQEYTSEQYKSNTKHTMNHSGGDSTLIYKNTKQNNITDWSWWWFVPLTWRRSQWPCHKCHSHLNTVTSYLWFPEYEQCATLPPFTVLFWELQCWMWHGLYTIEREVFNGYARPKLLSSSFAAPCTNALSTRCLMFLGTDIFLWQRGHMTDYLTHRWVADETWSCTV